MNASGQLSSYSSSITQPATLYNTRTSTTDSAGGEDVYYSIPGGADGDVHYSAPNAGMFSQSLYAVTGTDARISSPHSNSEGTHGIPGHFVPASEMYHGVITQSGLPHYDLTHDPSTAHYSSTNTHQVPYGSQYIDQLAVGPTTHVVHGRRAWAVAGGGADSSTDGDVWAETALGGVAEGQWTSDYNGLTQNPLYHSAHQGQQQQQLYEEEV
jgi:hypothetical protein